MKYSPNKIEKKWQRYWEENNFYQAKDFSKRPKFYLLVEFPYPSGEGLHVGHCRSYIALDIIARKMRMQGFNILFPMGWDAFGLPTENYAIKTGIHPKIATQKNTANFKRQEKQLGLSFDWSREIDTTDPSYYKWTQWIFVQIFKKGLAYKAKIPINWCPACKIGLANEEVVEGKCERCGAKVIKKERDQWMLKITKYADRLLHDLEKVDYPERVKTLQRDWIGRSEGNEVFFELKTQNSKLKTTTQKLKVITVFTTRLDTLFGCTYLVVAPEHPFVASLLKIKNQKFHPPKFSKKTWAGKKIKNSEAIERYIRTAKAKSDLERIEDKEKTGVKLEGVMAVNPANNQKIPIFVADYVLMEYGTGAIMGVPAHDKRDYEFAKKYGLEIREVISGGNIAKEAYVGEGTLINSGQFNGLNSKEAMTKISHWLEKRGEAGKKVQYKLRDWVFSRQRYWGEPIPLVFCPSCKKRVENSKYQITNSKQKEKFNKGELLNPGWLAVEENDLPVKLPEVKEYKPTEKGESPLATAENWLKVKCPKCGGQAKRETDVMPNWAGSNWYYLAYTMFGNQKLKTKNPAPTSGAGRGQKYIWDKKKMRYWLPVDWYNGGMEHATLHLLYSRFIYKFLWDIGAVPKTLGPEPYKKRTSHGVVLAEGGVKMSKSKGNVINPDEVIAQQGADTLRGYEMFMGPFDQAIAWSEQGVRGVHRFLNRAWDLIGKCSQNKKTSPEILRAVHKFNKRIDNDLAKIKFNTAVSAFMEFLNLAEENQDGFGKEAIERLLLLLAPFTPHLAEELWQQLHPEKYKSRGATIFKEAWPRPDAKLVEEEKTLFLIEINGKLRDKIELAKDSSEETVKEVALKREKIKKWLRNKKIKKIIFIKNRLLNIVI